jgi:hypothetical protein
LPVDLVVRLDVNPLPGAVAIELCPCAVKVMVGWLARIRHVDLTAAVNYSPRAAERTDPQGHQRRLSGGGASGAGY